ncbi:amino acid ABC transporter permease [Aeromicrobium marinum]|nr:amino acid ABC transporter permease [Aeromicrobium marinum]
MTEASVLFDAPGPRALRTYRILSIVTVVALVALAVVVYWRMETTGQLDYDLWEPFVTPAYLEVIGRSLLETLRAAGLAIVGALLFGVVFAAGKLSDHRVVRWPCWVVVEFFRAVPLLMLIFFVWSLYGFSTNIIAPLVVGLILYNGSVLAETFRAGMNAVPTGQVEAAYALGLRKNAVMRIVQLPQAIKIMLPALVSQCIVALKDTSLGYYIVAPGLTYAGRQIWNEFGNRLQTALVLAAIYIVLNLLLSLFATWLQKRLSSKEGAAVAAIGGPGAQGGF